jgi:hypothetical protein
LTPFPIAAPAGVPIQNQASTPSVSQRTGIANGQVEGCRGRKKRPPSQ